MQTPSRSEKAGAQKSTRRARIKDIRAWTVRRVKALKMVSQRVRRVLMQNQKDPKVAKVNLRRAK